MAPRNKKAIPFVFIVDDLIRKGHVAQARRALQIIRRDKLARAEWATVASLARRAGIPAKGLQLLVRAVRPSSRSVFTASAKEKAEYAACLSAIGAHEEAIDLLSEIDPAEVPEVLFYQSLAQFSLWEYAKAIPQLIQFCKSSSVSEYWRHVAKVNLVAAYVFERRHQDAEQLILELSRSLQSGIEMRLYGNLLELTAQNALLQKKWKEAEEALAKAKDALRDAPGMDSDMVTKWAAILRLLSGGATKKNLAELDRIREMVETRGDWESVRACDRFRCLATADEKLLWQLWCGTPYEPFRKRMLEDFGQKGEAPTKFLRRLGPLTGPREEINLDSPKGLESGGVGHRLLVALASDFYRPLRSAALHARVFPGEYYNPQSSPVRIYLALHRLRQWMSRGKTGLRVRVLDGEYSLTATKPVALEIRSGALPERREEYYFKRLQAEWADRPFTSQQAAKILGLSPRSVARLLEIPLRARTLTRSGKGKATTYQFANLAEATKTRRSSR